MIEDKIFEIFNSTPIDILDDDYYDNIVLTSERWKLVSPREDGSTKIGMFNIWLAMQTLSQNKLIELNDEVILDKLVEVCNTLIEKNVLREDATYRRKTFKLITNEELNAKREEDRRNSD